MNIRIDTNVFNKKYLPFLTDYTTKISVLVGSAGSGKSVAATQKAIIKLINNPKRRLLVVRKVQNSIRESCWKLFLETLSDWRLLSFVSVNKSNFTITFPNGSELVFRGLSDPERIKSITDIDDILIEEASELTGDDFDQLILRARHKSSLINQVTLCTNPTSKLSFIYKRWFAPGTVMDGAYILHSTYKDNKFLPPQYIKSLENLKNTNPTYYKIYALGEWTSLDKLIYTNYKVEPIKEADIKGLRHIVGLDFGFVNDLSALVESYVNLDKKILYINRCWGDTGKTNDEIARIITGLGLAKSEIVADSAEPKSIAELKKAGIMRIRQSVKGPDSIIHGIQRLQQYSIIVNPQCEGVITELENYSWVKDKKTNEYTNEPIDQFNHYLDALRYSIQLLDKSNTITFDKRLLF